MKNLSEKITAEATVTVSDANTAKAVKSGSLAVFATPAMTALMEEATCTAAAALLDEGETTVGTRICITHDRPSPVGEKITAAAVLEKAEGRKLTFSVSACDSRGNTIGKGTIERFVVLTDKFMSKVEKV